MTKSGITSGEDVDQQRGTEDVAVQASLFEQGPPEPVAIRHLADLRRTGIEAEAWPGKDGDAEIALVQCCPSQQHLSLPGLGEEQASRLAGVVPTEENTGFVTLEQQDHRQQAAIDAVERAADDPAGHSRP
jgi:hypothetical protein